MAFAWKQSKLGGGGGINCVGSSDDGSVVLAGGDISTMHRTMDDGANWENANRGYYDGGQVGATGAVTFRENSVTDALMGNKAGVWVTNDANDTCAWERAGASGSEFGTGGGSRPRPGTGGLADSVGNYSFIIAKAGTVYRYNWTTASLSNLGTLAGTGEGLTCDPSDADSVYACTTSGVWKITNATGSATMTKLTNGPGAHDISFAETSGGNKYIFVAAINNGIQRSAAFTTTPATGISFSQIKSVGMLLSAEWSAVVSGQLPNGSIRVAVSCGNAPVDAGTGVREHGWITDNGENASPTWTCFSLDDNNYELNRVGGDAAEINGDINWNYLPRSEGGNGGFGCLANTLSTQSPHVTEDMHMERDNPDRIWIGGRQGVWLLDVAAATLYPSMGSLGVQANGPVITDPNSPNHVYVMNTDHICMGTVDTGDTWRKNESGGYFSGETAGIDMNIETGVSISHCFLAHGDRNLSGHGGLYWHDDPMDFSDWTNLGFTAANGDAGDSVPTGVAVNRATYDGNTRRVVSIVQEGVGFRRGILSTANPPAIIEQLTTLSGSPAVNYTGGAEWCPVVYLDDDHVVFWNRIGGNIYYCRNIRTTGTPSVVNVKTDSSANANRGEGYMCKGPDSDTMFFSFADGSNKGVWKVTGWDAATGAGGLTWTEIDPPSGTWNRPGPLAYEIVNGTGSFFVMDNIDNDNGGAFSVPAKAYLSTNAAGTTLTDISGTKFASLVHKVYSASMSPNGNIYISQQGPGVIEYSEGAGGGDPDPDPGPGVEIEVFDPNTDLADNSNTSVYSVLLDASSYQEGDIVVVVTHSGDGDGANIPTITDTIGTTGGWTTQDSQLFNSGGKHLAIHTATLGSSPASGSVISTYADSQTGAGLSVLIVRGGTAVTQAQAATGSDASAELTLTTPPLQTSVVIAAVCDKVEEISIAWPAEFTETYEDGFNTPTQGISVAYDIDEASDTITATGVSSGEWAMVAIEIEGDAAQGGQAEVSYVEFEVPELEAAAIVSYVELEIPDDTAETEVSFIELEVPSTTTGAAQVSWIRAEIPDKESKFKRVVQSSYSIKRNG